MQKIKIKRVRRLNKGRVELTFYGIGGKRVNPVQTKDRDYKEGDWIDYKTLKPL